MKSEYHHLVFSFLITTAAQHLFKQWNFQTQLICHFGNEQGLVSKVSNNIIECSFSGNNQTLKLIRNNSRIIDKLSTNWVGSIKRKQKLSQ